MPSPVAVARLNADALNRSFRTILQAAALEVGVQVVPWLINKLQDDSTVWNVDLAQSGGRIAALAALAFVMRRYLDPSKVPTPLPPANPGPPADPPV